MSTLFFHLLDVVFGIGLGFLAASVAKGLMEPVAARVGRMAYQHVTTKYLQSTLDNLDGQLAQAFRFVDDAILPKEVKSEPMREALKQAVLNEFSLAVWLEKAQNR